MPASGNCTFSNVNRVEASNKLDVMACLPLNHLIVEVSRP